MKFGPVPAAAAEGAVLAHSVSAGGVRFRKARRLTREDVEALARAGVASVIVARMEPGDIDEDEAARRIAASLNGGGFTIAAPSTGRVNIHAEKAGVFTASRALIDRLNAIDPALTIATLPDMETVRERQMVATLKVIPFAVASALAERWRQVAGEGEALRVHPFEARRVGLIHTTLPSLKSSVIDKTTRITRQRLARSGSAVTEERRVVHATDALAPVIAELCARCDLLIVFGASAIADPHDVIPDAIDAAGGRVKRVGMPVDPGNLLALGELAGVPVIGAPGCARSPRRNGFDFVLDRLMTGLSVGEKEIAGMGVGGLLADIATRPQPREQKSATVGAILLAAGSARRMGGPNKLLARFEGRPVIERLASAICASRAERAVAVLGHQHREVADALAPSGIDTVFNAHHADGMAGSLKAGIAALDGLDAALVALGDMPLITTEHLDRLIDAFRRGGGSAIVRACDGDRPGNPVILPASLFPQVALLEGDAGARHLVEASGLDVIEVDIGRAARLDIDTPQALSEAGGSFLSEPESSEGQGKA